MGQGYIGGGGGAIEVDKDGVAVTAAARRLDFKPGTYPKFTVTDVAGVATVTMSQVAAVDSQALVGNPVTLSASYADLFGTTFQPYRGPNYGLYVSTTIYEDWSGVTASSAIAYTEYDIYINGAASGSVIRGGQIGIIAAALTGFNKIPVTLTWMTSGLQLTDTVRVKGRVTTGGSITGDVTVDGGTGSKLLALSIIT